MVDDSSVKSTGVAQTKFIHSEATLIGCSTRRWEVKGNSGPVLVISY